MNKALKQLNSAFVITSLDPALDVKGAGKIRFALALTTE